MGENHGVLDWLLASLQSQRSELASGVVLGLQWEQIRGSRGLVSTNVNICGAEADEIIRVPSAAMLAFGFFLSGKSFWVYL